MSETIFYNALSITLESDYRKLTKLRERHKTWEAAWNNFAGKGDTDPEKAWARLESSGAKLILDDDPLYPRELKEIAQPPLGIYYIGNLPKKDDIMLAVVGTRKATNDGKNIAKNFAKALGAKAITIVSGLALGIDAEAHLGCLEAGGKTIAVLGCGLDRFYPSTNERLAKKILERGGAIISEYPIGSPPLPYRFLERNRIVSGIARGTLVVEAPKESGALVTARHALDQNRDVFVIPGPISHPNYIGSNQLIRRGGELITRPEEILEAWGMDSGEKTLLDRKFDSEAERTIFEILSKETKPLGSSEISQRTKIGIGELNGTLTMMLLKEMIEENGIGYTIK